MGALFGGTPFMDPIIRLRPLPLLAQRVGNGCCLIESLIFTSSESSPWLFNASAKTGGEEKTLKYCRPDRVLENNFSDARSSAFRSGRVPWSSARAQISPKLSVGKASSYKGSIQ
jgi:hypothetical protein